MDGFRSLGKTMSIPMIGVMIATSLPVPPAGAALIGTEQVIQTQTAKANRIRVEQFLQREDVRRQIEALGVDGDEAAARVASLSDAEVEMIAGKIDQLPAGQGVIETIVIAAGIVFIVLLITDLAGITDVFGFIR